jgi:hypothetical protein
MSTFLNVVVAEGRKRNMSVRPIACGGRTEAFDKFCDAWEKEPDVLNILLVDSEDPVAITASPWNHLHNRQGYGWTQPAGADDSRCHMMVACMEAWFLADPEGLKRHFRKNFDVSALPSVAQAETRTKADINTALKQATRLTAAQEYRKIRDGAKLLAAVDPLVVRKHCKWCERFFRWLGSAIGARV